MKSPTLILPALVAGAMVLAQGTARADVDTNSDGLDDVWQELFGAQTLVATDDTDGDGDSNKDECSAGTDPFDPSSRLVASAVEVGPDGTPLTVSFESEYGKLYCLELSDSLDSGAWSQLPTEYHGTGETITVQLSATAAPQVTGAVLHEVWSGVTGDDVPSLSTHTAAFSDPPDAVESLGELRAPKNIADQYGARMRGLLIPKVSGSHTLYLSSRHHSELLISPNAGQSAASVLARVTTDILAPEEWNRFPEQSVVVNLSAGQSYYIEVRHQHGSAADHCAVGWQQPGSANIEIISGEYLQPFFRAEPNTTEIDGNIRKFIRVTVKDLDQDGDGISDWAEKQMGGDHGFHFASPNSTSSGLDDITTLLNALGGGTQTISLSALDTEATEDPRSAAQLSAGSAITDVSPDPVRLRLERTGSLQPVIIQFSLGTTGQQSSTALAGTDFIATDLDGSPITSTISLPFGRPATEIILTPVADGIHEYPEKLRCTLIDAGGPGAGDYDLGATYEADSVFYDANDITEQETLFVGRSSRDPNAVNPDKGTAIVSAFLNGRKDHLRMNTLIMAPFSSPQNDSHIHKANPGPTAGGIVYEITEVAGDPASDPKIGELLDYPWEIDDSQGSATGTAIVDSLFVQNGETPLYLNWHTNDNQGGELWAIFVEETGSISEPDPPAAPPAITALTGSDLERDVRRFLNQATFGATDPEVAALITEITTTHAAEPTPRIAAYEAWIDDQIDNTDQTYLVDYVLAADNQEWKLRGFYDSSRWFTHLGNDPVNPAVDVPDLPTTWPTIDRSRPDPNEWFPTQNYPLSQTQINWGKNEDLYTLFDLGEVNFSNRRRAQWLFMANAKDQLRQKMGYSLQQILVVSESLSRIQQDHLAAANYQDQLNYHAFSHYRDAFAFVNRSPIMGKWLSSLKNQKAYDISGDGVPDVFPDENLAREDLQLFSIGLFNLWPDGTLKLSDTTGLPEPTYTNADITEFARVLTGQSFSRYAFDPETWGVVAGVDTGDPFDTDNGNLSGDEGILFNENNPFGGTESQRQSTVDTSFNRGEGNKYYNHQFSYPMQMFADYHDLGVKTMPGGKPIDNTAMSDGDLSQSGGRADEIAHAEQDLNDAISWLAGNPGDGEPDFDMVNSHRSTPAFIARRLIQRFTTSNPSSAYLYRVSDAFRNGEGDLRATIKAILLDYEVRELAAVDADATAGMKKAPLDLYLQLLRNFSQRYDATTDSYKESVFSELPLDSGRAIPGGIAAAPPADGYIENFGYPASQKDNFTINGKFRYPNTDDALGMTPFAQETVFNYFRTDYSPGGPVANAGMVSPEMQIATETSVIANANFLYTITYNLTGLAANPIGGDPGSNAADTDNKPGSYNQRLLYGDATPDDDHTSDTYDNVRLTITDWALNTIRWGSTAADRLGDMTELVDAIDLRLTGGRFAALYPYDSSDDEDPATDGTNPSKSTYNDGVLTNDGENRNPREILIQALVGMNYNPYSATPENARRDLFRNALYLFSTTPEFMVQK